MAREDQEMSLWARRVLDLVSKDPGLSKEQLHKRAGENYRMVDAGLGELLLRNLVRVERPAGRGFVARIYLQDENVKRVVSE